MSKPSPTARAATFFGWLVLVMVALTVWCSYARAEHPDGGPLDDVPLAVYAADGGPFDGVCKTTRRSVHDDAWCLAQKQRGDDFKKALQEKPEGIDPGTALKAAGAAFLLGVAAGAYLAKKL